MSIRLDICKTNGWDYIIRYKEGSVSSIAKEYQAMPEKENYGKDIEYQNEVIFGEDNVNLIYNHETKKVNGEEKITEYAWITSIKITGKNAK